MTDVTYPRHRSRGQDHEMIAVTVRGHTPFQELTVSEDRCLFTEMEDIWDGTGSRRESHAVLHHKIQLATFRITNWELTPVPGGLTNWTASPYWVPRSPYLLQRNNIVDWMDNSSFERGGPRWSQFMANAFGSVTEQIPVVIDVPNLLRDLFTLKGLASQCRHILLKLLEILKKIGGYAGHFAHLLTLRSMVKQVSDSYLIYSFGLKPLVREVESLLGSVARILNRINFLRRTQGSTFTARYSEYEHYTSADRILDLADNVGFADSCLWLRDVDGTITYTCTARVKNNLVGLSGLTGSIKGALAALGGRDVIKFLWDLVPFSFVVDWIYNVSDIAERYATINPYGGSLDVVSADASFKKLATANLTIEGPRLSNGTIDYGLLRFEQYDRQPSFDCSLNVLMPETGFTPHQLGILAALVGQRA